MVTSWSTASASRLGGGDGTRLPAATKVGEGDQVGPSNRSSATSRQFCPEADRTVKRGVSGFCSQAETSSSGLTAARGSGGGGVTYWRRSNGWRALTSGRFGPTRPAVRARQTRTGTPGADPQDSALPGARTSTSRPPSPTRTATTGTLLPAPSTPSSSATASTHAAGTAGATTDLVRSASSAAAKAAAQTSACTSTSSSGAPGAGRIVVRTAFGESRSAPTAVPTEEGVGRKPQSVAP